MLAIIFSLLLPLIGGALIYVLKNKANKQINYSLIEKICLFTLLGVIFIRLFSNDAFVTVINGGNFYGTFYQKIDVFETITRWFMMFAEVILLTMLVTKNKVNKFISSFICLPLVIVSLINLPHSIDTYFSPSSINVGGFIYPYALTIILCSIEYAICLFVPSILLFKDRKELFVTEKKDIISVIKVVIISFLICIPFLTYASIFGDTSLVMRPFEVAHIGWLISIPVVGFIIYFTFRNEDKDIRSTILSVMVFYLFFHFNSCFKIGVTTSRLPIQLCNLVSYLLVILLFTKNKHLFNFVYVANPVGAVVAFVSLSDRGSIFYFWIIHYLIEHLYVFLIPIFFVVFGYMERPKFKQLVKDYFIVFSIYFTFCLLFSCFNNGYLFGKADRLVKVNFFYLLDCPVKDIFPFYSSLQTLQVSLFKTDFYLTYIAFIYCVFSLLSLLFYWMQIGIHNLVIRFKYLISRHPKSNI